MTALAWALVVNAAGNVRGKSFWMSRRTYAALLAERGRETRGRLYSVPVAFDDAMTFGHITLERRVPK